MNSGKSRFIYILLIFLIFFVFEDCYARTLANSELKSRKTEIIKKIQPVVYIGFAVGHETFVSATFPKFGVLGYLPLGNDSRSYDDKRNLSKFAIYGGADLSIFALFQPAIGVTGYSGVKMRFFTIDNSLAFLNGFPDGKIVNDKHQFTYNPKIGIKLGSVWLKVGPSFIIEDRWIELNKWMKVGSHFYNIDLNIILK
jgi:hypothetical protein